MSKPRSEKSHVSGVVPHDGAWDFDGRCLSPGEDHSGTWSVSLFTWTKAKGKLVRGNAKCRIIGLVADFDEIISIATAMIKAPETARTIDLTRLGRR